MVNFNGMSLLFKIDRMIVLKKRAILFIIVAINSFFAQAQINNITEIRLEFSAALSEEYVEINAVIENDSIYSIIKHHLPANFEYIPEKIDDSLNLKKGHFPNYYMEVLRTERTYQKVFDTKQIEKWLKQMETLDFGKIVNTEISSEDGTLTVLKLGNRETHLTLHLRNLSLKNEMSHWQELSKWIIDLLNYFGLNGNKIIR